jgi:pimeloyl-ACP methyl ester carboxylesterase
MRNRRISTAILSGLAAVFASGCSGPGGENDVKAAAPESFAMPLKSVPTFSAENVGRMGNFYVGGKWEGPPGKEIMRGAMYVNVWVPKNIRYPYPIVWLGDGGGQTVYGMLQTPDGRPGWAFDFVNQGYTVYMPDLPARGRSAYVPELDGEIVAPRSGPLMSEIWTHATAPNPELTEPGEDGHGPTWPQFSKYSGWPSDHPNKGRMGDPVFDYFAKTEQHNLAGGRLPDITIAAMVNLIDLIGQPVILLLHSGAGTLGFNVADARPQLVKGIIAAEPASPPIENAERRAAGHYEPGRLWGPTGLPIKYEPAIKAPSELRPVRQDKADRADLIPCWLQQEPAHKLVNLTAIPVLSVAGEASYHRPYAHCLAKWLNQAGVKTTFVGLEEVGLPGNSHNLVVEKNSAGIAKYFMTWLEKNVR